VNIILVKPGLLDVWVQEFLTTWDKEPSPLRLVIVYPEMAKNYPQYALTDDTKEQAMTKKAWKYARDKQFDDTRCSGRRVNNGVIVLSIPQSIGKHFVEPMRFGPGAPYTQKPGARVFMFIVDEFHESYRENAPV
jgi:hypothetical protein